MATVSGGEKLKAALSEMAAKVAKPATLRVGFLSNARYPDGTPVAMVAAIQDFGAPAAGIPPRPFFRNMIAAKSGEWAWAVELNLKATNYDVNKTLTLVGEGIAGQLKQSIVDLVDPPLKPSTIRKKHGVTKPLIDTGHMLASVDYEVL